MPGSAIGIVIPVKNAAGLIAECVGPIVEQLGDGDRLVVVDDASEDDTADRAEALGAAVVRRAGSGGPYVARNDGWRRCPQPYVLFTDVRCVVRPGWLERFRRETARGVSDLVFSDIVVRGGPRLAERAAARRQHLVARIYATDPYFLPYFPTANLAVRRTALEAVDGFRDMFSGGDADLCWRVQLAGFTEVCGISEELMEWRPRQTVRAFLEQWAKYGDSNALLRHTYAPLGAPIAPAVGLRERTVRHGRNAARRILREHERDVQAVMLDEFANALFERAYARRIRQLGH